MKATLTIDLEAICANWRALDAMSGPDVETAAVVKANAYGLGAVPVCKALARAGARTFFVAEVSEAVVLRKALGPTPRLFNFSGQMEGDAAALLSHDIIPVLNSVEQISRFDGPRCAVQFDSGMNRLGLEAAEIEALTNKITALKPELVMSHLACADEVAHPMNAMQLAEFIRQNVMAPRSLAATGGVLLGADYHFEMTRPGIGLYGGLPFAAARPVVQLDLPVIQVRDVQVGEIVGYGNAWTAARPSKIATVAAGYADGILRAAKDIKLFAGETPCPSVGRISMDLITVDVTDLTEVPTTLSLLNKIQTIDVLAEHAGTIGYEILTSLGGRYNRVYIGAEE